MFQIVISGRPTSMNGGVFTAIIRVDIPHRMMGRMYVNDATQYNGWLEATSHKNADDVEG